MVIATCTSIGLYDIGVALLEDILKKPKNSVVREKLLKHRFLYDVQLSYLSKGSSIVYYEADYDRNGFDILLDNLGHQRHFQMKSMVHSSATNSFLVHRTLLRPRISDLNYYPLSHDSFGVGFGGGVVLIIAKEIEGELEVYYRFCDGLILCAFAAGYLSYRSNLKNKSVINSFTQYQDSKKIGGMINLSKSCFLEFTSLENLMNFAGLGLYGDGPRWNLQRAVARFYGLSNQVDRKLSTENWKSIVHKDLDEMLLWNGLEH